MILGGILYIDYIKDDNFDNVIDNISKGIFARTGTVWVLKNVSSAVTTDNTNNNTIINNNSDNINKNNEVTHNNNISSSNNTLNSGIYIYYI